MPTTAELAKIHIGIKAIGLDDEQYRALLWDRYQKSSAKDLTSRQVFNLLEYLKSRGFKPKAAKKAVRTTLASDPQDRKIRALWIELGKAGVVKNTSEVALRRYVERLTGVADLRWCAPFQKSTVIESLKQWQIRAQK